MKNIFHTSNVGIGNKQAVWVKGLAVLLVLGFALTAISPALHQANHPSLMLVDGDKPKIGTGG